MQYKNCEHGILGLGFSRMWGHKNEKGDPEEPPLFGAISDQIIQLNFHSTEGDILINKI
jgi:hypothetical protein